MPFEQSLIGGGLAIGTKLLGARAVYIGGRYLSGMVMRNLARVLRSYKLDETAMAYLSSIINVLLNIVSAMGLLGYFGVETTSFAALLAGAASPSARLGAAGSRILPPVCSC